MTTSAPLRVLVWDENPTHAPKAVYPHGINGAIVEGLNSMAGDRLLARAVNQDEPEQGLARRVLEETDVLVWWSHVRNDQLEDELSALVQERVRHFGLGFIVLHSGFLSKPFRGLLNCTGNLKGGWREDDQPEEVRVCAPRHPIARGLSDFTVAREEMYGAPFEVPSPSCVVFQSYFPAGGEYFPSGITWTVGDGIDPAFALGPGGGANQGEGKGRVFYFRPGHESCPTYYDENVRRVIANAALWAGRREG